MQIISSLEEQQPKGPASVALGLFDGLHIGHQAVLRQALDGAGEGLLPMVFTYRITGQIPQIKKNYFSLMTEEHKWELLQKMGFEQVLCPDFMQFCGLSPEEFVEDVLIGRMNARRICCGRDFTFGKDARGNVEMLRRLAGAHGVQVVVVDPVMEEGRPVSSTRIREEILAGRMDCAARMLGRRFCIDFIVSHGNEIGRQIHFPTINQSFPPHHIVPKYGVYATLVEVGRKIYGGVTNVGVKPTVGSPYPLSETYILDFEGDLYGQCIRVLFYDFIRPEVRFGSIEELKAQIAEDTETVRSLTPMNLVRF